MKRLLTIAIMLLTTTMLSFGQMVWHNPILSNQTSYIHGQGWNEDGGNYHRFPNRAQDRVRAKVWELACQSAGLSIRFKTDAKDISIRYQVTQPLNMPHMPSTGVSGVIYIDTKIKGFVSEAIRLETQSPTITESIKRSRARRRSSISYTYHSTTRCLS